MFDNTKGCPDNRKPVSARPLRGSVSECACASKERGKAGKGQLPEFSYPYSGRKVEAKARLSEEREPPILLFLPLPPTPTRYAHGDEDWQEEEEI